jgi:hypothetical protein
VKLTHNSLEAEEVFASMEALMGIRVVVLVVDQVTEEEAYTPLG